MPTETAEPADTRAAGASPSDDVVAMALAELGPSVFRVAYSVLRDRALAEDAAQETMVRAWSNIERFRGDSSLRVWVLRIAHNVSVSMLRKRRDEVVDPHTMTETDAPQAGRPDRRAEGRAMAVDLWRVLDELDPMSRAVVVLREVEGMSYEDIAAALGLALPTVKTRLFRARRTLATRLEEWR